MKKILPFYSLFLILLLLTSYETTAQKKYRVVVFLKDGERHAGELRQSTHDSLRMRMGRVIRAFSVEEIKYIKVRRKGVIGRSIGVLAGVGAFVGGVIGYASYQPVDCSNSFLCFDFGPEMDVLAGAIIGAAAGSALGAALGTANHKITIEGNASQLDVFNNEFTGR